MARAARELQRCNICSSLSKATSLVEVPELGATVSVSCEAQEGSLHMLPWMVEMGLAYLRVSPIQSYEFLEDRLVLKFRGFLPVEEKCCH